MKRRFGADVVAPARFVLDENLLAQPLRQPLRHDPRRNVGASARRISHDPTLGATTKRRASAWPPSTRGICPSGASRKPPAFRWSIRRSTMARVEYDFISSSAGVGRDLRRIISETETPLAASVNRKM